MAKSTNKDEFSKSTANDRKTIIAGKNASDDEFWSEPSENDQPFSSFGVTEGGVPNPSHTKSGRNSAQQAARPEDLATEVQNPQSFEEDSDLSGEVYGDGQAENAFNFSDDQHEQAVSNDVVGLSLAAERAAQTQSSFRNHAATISKKIDLNAPLYPIEDNAQEEPVPQPDAPQAIEFDLPQSLEEASIRLGDPNLILGHDESYERDPAANEAIDMNFGHGEDGQDASASAASGAENPGPVVTMTEPELREFSQRDAEQNRTKTGFSGPSAKAVNTGNEQEISPEKFAQLALAAFNEDDARGNSRSYEHTTQTGPEFDPYAEFTAIVESRNTKTREVKLTQEEFSRAEQQILESRQVHISGKVLVLDAVAITRQIPQDGSRRRRRSA